LISLKFVLYCAGHHPIIVDVANRKIITCTRPYTYFVRYTHQTRLLRSNLALNCNTYTQAYSHNNTVRSNIFMLPSDVMWRAGGIIVLSRSSVRLRVRTETLCRVGYLTHFTKLTTTMHYGIQMNASQRSKVKVTVE